MDTPGGSEEGKEEERGGKLTRVVFRTLHRRGKSLTPASRIEMLDPRMRVLEVRDETQEERGWGVVIFFLREGR